MLHVLERLLAQKEEHLQMVNALFSYLSRVDDLASCLLLVFERSGELSYLLSVDWSQLVGRPVFSMFIQMAVRYSILEDIVINKDWISNLVSEQCWVQIIDHIDVLSIDELCYLVAKASCELSDNQFKRAAMLSESIFHRLMLERPALACPEMNHGHDSGSIFDNLGPSYWIERHNIGTFGVSQSLFTRAVDNKDFTVLSLDKGQAAAQLDAILSSSYGRIRRIGIDILFVRHMLNHLHNDRSARIISESSKDCCLRMSVSLQSTLLCSHTQRIYATLFFGTFSRRVTT